MKKNVRISLSLFVLISSLQVFAQPGTLNNTSDGYGKIILAGGTEVNFQLDMAVYRLNGRFPTSVVSPNSPLHLITVNPNPVAHKVFLNADGLPNGRYQYTITTLDGKLTAPDFIKVSSR